MQGTEKGLAIGTEAIAIVSRIDLILTLFSGSWPAVGPAISSLQNCAFLPRRILRNKCKESAPSRDILRGKPVDAPDPHT